MTTKQESAVIKAAREVVKYWENHFPPESVNNLAKAIHALDNAPVPQAQEQDAVSLETCLELAAQAWCTPNTKHLVMDASLAVAFAKILFRMAEKQKRQGEA